MGNIVSMIKLSTFSFLFGAFYCPPSHTEHIDDLFAVLSSIPSYSQTTVDEIILTGDFNVNAIRGQEIVQGASMSVRF